MASSPLRRLLEDRVSQLLADAELLAGESRQRAVRECAERLNQAVRRIRQAETLAELGATLVDSCVAFAAGAALFEIEGETARLQEVRGLESEEVPAGFEIALASAPALAGAIQTRDPMIAAALPGEISSALAGLPGHSPDGRVSILPIAVGELVPGILYAWGTAEESALELLAQVAAAVWTSLAAPRPAISAPLVSIQPAAGEIAPGSWDALSPEEQQIHLRAQRFARVQAAQMRLFEANAVQSGRTRRNLYTELRAPIDAARVAFQEKFFALCPSMLDYLHLELVRTLANDDVELLGPDYPGPMV